MCAAVDPAVNLSTHSLLPMVSFVDHADHSAPSASKVVDDDEAPDSNEPEMGRRRSRVAERGVRGLTGSGAVWFGSRWRRTGGVEGRRDGLANGGVALHSEAW